MVSWLDCTWGAILAASLVVVETVTAHVWEVHSNWLCKKPAHFAVAYTAYTEAGRAGTPLRILLGVKFLELRSWLILRVDQFTLCAHVRTCTLWVSPPLDGRSLFQSKLQVPVWYIIRHNLRKPRAVAENGVGAIVLVRHLLRPSAAMRTPRAKSPSERSQ